MILYTYTADNMNIEKETFLRFLYHDSRNGVMIRLRKDLKGGVSSFSTTDIEELAATGTDDAHIYTSVNTFRGARRTADKVFNYGSIYIDLDCHAEDPEAAQAAKEKTVELLEQAYASGEIAVPTLITDTGRGFGIQYVLNKSIANGNNVAQRNFFKKVRQGIFDQYKQLMEAEQAAQPDPAVLDDARVCRMPGTYNKAAERYCRLIYAEEHYFELSELVKSCHLWDWEDKETYQQKKEQRQGKKATARKIIPFEGNYHSFLQNRIEQLQMLQRIRKDACTNRCREQLLFIAYSALVQVDREHAVERLHQMNAEFTQPLDKKEVVHIIEETDADQKGYYKLPDEYVVRTLDLTEEEITALRFGSGWKRTAAKRATAKKRNEIRNQVVKLLGQADRLSYNEIAELVGISRRTVCTIAKEAGISRYKKNVSDPEVVDSSEETVEAPQKREQTKSANFCIESVCVDSVRGVLAAFSGTGVIYEQLLRAYDECACIEGLQLLLLKRMSHSVSLYSGLSLTALMTAQLDDLCVLAKWLIEATPFPEQVL